MKTKERIVHSVLFEIIAILILIPLGNYLGGINTKSIVEIAILLSLIAMCWNFVFNKIFDSYFTENRSQRGIMMRVLHGFLFELGLLVVTIPIIMLHLDMNFLHALKLDLGIILFFFIFAIIFNWVYDLLRQTFNPTKIL